MVKKVKIIFMGDSGVGKSSVISCLNGHPISLRHEPTIGMDFSTKICQGSQDSYKLQLWDTAGQQKFRSIMPSYIRSSKIAVLIYDITCTCEFISAGKSFLNLEKWIDMFQQSACQSSKLVVAGNKIDLYSSRQVCMQKVQEKIVKYQLPYLEISAKTGEGVKELLEVLIAELDKMDIRETKKADTVKLRGQGESDRDAKKKGCCKGN